MIGIVVVAKVRAYDECIKAVKAASSIGEAVCKLQALRRELLEKTKKVEQHVTERSCFEEQSQDPETPTMYPPC